MSIDHKKFVLSKYKFVYFIPRSWSDICLKWKPVVLCAVDKETSLKCKSYKDLMGKMVIIDNQYNNEIVKNKKVGKNISIETIKYLLESNATEIIDFP